MSSQKSLLRLVADAGHATPNGGRLKISTTVIESALKKSVRVTVWDSGKSMRVHAKERVFDPYYQSRPGNRNSGFSLALFYPFVAMNGGSIEVDSAPGKGTAYRLTFPIADKHFGACLQGEDIAC